VNKQLNQAFENLLQKRNSLLNLAKTLPTEKITHRVNPNQWSVLEILNHLYTAEKLSLQYIKKKSQGIDSLGNAGFKQAVMMLILKISQRLPFRYKAPATVLQNTVEVLSLSDLIAQWDLLYLELKSILVNTPEKHVHKLVYKHAVAGRLSLVQAIIFFREHMIHHTPQILKQVKS
jgi:uncharacterized damage-inducible protein DinB